MGKKRFKTARAMKLVKGPFSFFLSETEAHFVLSTFSL